MSYDNPTPEERLAECERKVLALHKQVNAVRGGWYRYSLVLVTHDNEGNETPERVYEYVRKAFAHISGNGWSESAVGKGGWPMPDGSLVHEGHVVFTTLGKYPNMEEDFTLKGAAKRVAQDLGQDAVMVSWERLDGGVAFVTADHYQNID